jgi:multimeric flavodoxin WrbA
MSKIVVFVGSVRKGGNTELLARAFAEGARQKHEVDVISVADYRVNPCIGCDACARREGNTCFQQDDMPAIYAKLTEADVVVIASPVYFYGISAQLKAVIDRLHTPMREKFPIKKAAMLLVAAAEGPVHLPTVFDSIKMQYQLVIDFFKIQNAGMVLVGNVKEPGDIKDHPALKEAFDLGASIAP